MNSVSRKIIVTAGKEGSLAVGSLVLGLTPLFSIISCGDNSASLPPVVEKTAQTHDNSSLQLTNLATTRAPDLVSRKFDALSRRIRYSNVLSQDGAISSERLKSLINSLSYDLLQDDSDLDLYLHADLLSPRGVTAIDRRIAEVAAQSDHLDAQQQSLVEHRQNIVTLIELYNRTLSLYLKLQLLFLDDIYHRQQLVQAQDAVNDATLNNWSGRREAILYTIGFKWLWGLFTGYAPSTDASAQQAQLDRLTREYEEFQEISADKFSDLTERIHSSVAEFTKMYSVVRSSPYARYSLARLTKIESVILDLAANTDNVSAYGFNNWYRMHAIQHSSTRRLQYNASRWLFDLSGLTLAPAVLGNDLWIGYTKFASGTIASLLSLFDKHKFNPIITEAMNKLKQLARTVLSSLFDAARDAAESFAASDAAEVTEDTTRSDYINQLASQAGTELQNKLTSLSNAARADAMRSLDAYIAQQTANATDEVLAARTPAATTPVEHTTEAGYVAGTDLVHLGHIIEEINK